MRNKYLSLIKKIYKSKKEFKTNYYEEQKKKENSEDLNEKELINELIQYLEYKMLSSDNSSGKIHKNKSKNQTSLEFLIQEKKRINLLQSCLTNKVQKNLPLNIDKMYRQFLQKKTQPSPPSHTLNFNLNNTSLNFIDTTPHQNKTMNLQIPLNYPISPLNFSNHPLIRENFMNDTNSNNSNEVGFIFLKIMNSAEINQRGDEINQDILQNVIVNWTKKEIYFSISNSTLNYKMEI